LNHRTDRNEHVVQQIETIGYTAIRIEAVECKQGAIGCGMSHIRCLELAKEQNLPFVCIVEDDITFTNPDLFRDQLDSFLSSSIDWDVLLLGTNMGPPFYKEKGCVAKCIKCPKGSMVLWDSRTIHCGLEPLKGRKTQNFRCVAYLCYMPRVLAKESQIIKKIKAFEEKRMTTHWPCNIKLFPKIPRTYGAEIPEITELPTPIINELGRRLVGYSTTI
jgi:GR25 family glycosyltransferase involved in LPS biosynthesis